MMVAFVKMKKEAMAVLIPFLLLLILKETSGSYIIKIFLHSLENRGGRCADKQFCNGGEGCCESSTCATTACEYILEFCQRLPPRPLNHEPLIDLQPNCANSRNSGDPVRFERNLTNFAGQVPLSFSYSSLMYDTVQIYFELRHNKTVLIDRFLLDVPSIPDYHLTPFYLDGIFGFARMNISVSLECFQGNCGEFCEQVANCSVCEAGYTGRFCSNAISLCEPSKCDNSTMRCRDKDSDIECVCNPGFTGEDCLTDINECTGEEVCSFQGKCMNTVGSFLCECNDDYTGQFCETQLPRYAIDITFHSFNNPGGKCADLSGTCANGSGCCDSRDCRDVRCNYMFLYCLRPLGSVVSYIPSENRGNCDFNETNANLIAVGDDFFSTIYGTPNPIKYTSQQSPLNRMEFYIELIDDDSQQRGDENNELVDRFIIPINSITSNSIYFGIFNLASINISINIHCSEFYLGDQCNQRKTEAIVTNFAATTTITAVVPVLAAVLSIVTIISLLSISFLVICWRFSHRKRRALHEQLFELRAIHQPSGNEGAVIQLEQSHSLSGTQTIRDRLESVPNSYDALKKGCRRTGNDNLQHTGGFPSLLPGELNLGSNYEEIDAPLMGTLRSTQTNESESKPQVYIFSEKMEDRYDDNAYDYDAPYWDPSNEERGLLSQLEKLKIPSARTSNIRELEIIGSGAFGTVVKATWSQKENSKYDQKLVAVKKIEGGVSDEERIIFLKEAVIMGQFSHPNIVKILGIVADGNEGQYKIIMEYMPNGNLRQYLHSLDKSADVLSSQLLAFSRQIASAMSYLSVKGYVHRDLAARNILICDNSTCKIADFGLSRDICTESFYLAHGGKIPVKWAAPESINYRLWSTASDVWSYGCVLYEIWSLGYKPFHNCNNAEVLSKLSSGYRLPPPVGCPRAIYQLMINCWNIESDSRPSFCEILSYLNEPEYKITGWSQNDKDQFDEESRRIGGNLDNGNKLYVDLQNTYKKT